MWSTISFGPVPKWPAAFPRVGRWCSPASRASWRPASPSTSWRSKALAPRHRPRWRKTGRAGALWRRQPDCLAVKAGGIEIARVTDLLIIQDGARAIFGRRRLDRVLCNTGCAATRQGFADHAPAQFAFGRKLDAGDFRHGRSDVGIGDRSRVGISLFETRSHRGHEVAGLGP